jgi:hypothetical protein
MWDLLSTKPNRSAHPIQLHNTPIATLRAGYHFSEILKQ